MNDRAGKVAALVRSLFRPRGGLETLEVLEVHAEDKKQKYLESSGASEELVEAAVQGLDMALAHGELTQGQLEALEAIVLRDKCPTLEVFKDEIVGNPKGEWGRLRSDNAWLKGFIQAAGRLDCDALAVDYAGSGFLVGPDLVITNRHVAQLFADGVGEAADLRFLDPTELDYRHEKPAPTERDPVAVDQVLLIHPYWDVAVLRVKRVAGRTPITLAHEPPGPLAGRPMAVVGYPFFRFVGAEYDRKVLLDNFGDTPGWKRLQPGWLTDRLEFVPDRGTWPRVMAVGHQASTLGGNSGSLVIDLDARRAIGVHFAGKANEINWAVPTWELYRDPRVRALGVQFSSDGKDAVPDPLVEKAWAALGKRGTVSVPEKLNGHAADRAPAQPGTASAGPKAERPAPVVVAPASAVPAPSAAAAAATTVTVPIELEISVRVRAPGASSAVTMGTLPSNPASAVASGTTEGLESINFDDDYDDRTGYDPDFLDVSVPLPSLTEAGMKQVSRDRTRDAPDNHVLHYHHFSVVMNKRRRVAFFTACNTTRDPALFGQKSRKALSASEPWRPDPRIPVTHQITTAEFYKGSVFDRGHLVRREDAYWGGDEDEQEFANFDSFHYTNCSPQHKSYNRSSESGLWGLLENQIASESQAKDLRLSLFSGPVLAPRDPVFRDVRVPRAFWKVVVSIDDETGKLGAWAFRLSQAKLVATVEEIFDPGRFVAQQIPVAELHEITEVRFPDVVLAADTYRKKARAAASESAVAE